MAFHWKDGWYFERLNDGGVRIFHLPVGEQIADENIEIDADSWASIISSVSEQGETAETFKEAGEFHNKLPTKYEVIRIEPYRGVKSKETLQEQHEYWEVAKQKVFQGKPELAHWVFTGMGVEGYEFFWVANTLYKRELPYQQLFTKEGKDDNGPDILCECGSDAFKLYYGNYEIRAVCPKCGKEQVVYDG